MATEKRPPSGSPGARRRRPAPTIDLKATEVAVEPTASAPPPQAEPPFEAAKAAEPSGASSPEPTIAAPHERSTRHPEPEPQRPGTAWLPLDFPWPAAAAGAVGAAGVLLVFLLIWLVVPRGDPAPSLAPRLAAIETQLRDLAVRLAAPSIDPAAIGTLSDRLAKLESAPNALRQPVADPALGSRIGALEGMIKPLNDSVAALTRRADEADAALRNIRSRVDTAAAALAELQNAARASSADHGEIVKLSDRVAALEKADRAVADQLAKSVAAAGSDRPVRLAVAAGALRAALERGDPFAAELAAVKPLTKDALALSAIEPFAASGVPGGAALGRELLVLLPVMQRTAGSAPRDGGFLDRLQANAERLVRIRPIEEIPGEDVTAILSRMEVKAAHADIAGALAELAKLPPAVRAPALAWIAKAEARNKAIEASRRLAADAISALKTAQ